MTPYLNLWTRIEWTQNPARTTHREWLPREENELNVKHRVKLEHWPRLPPSNRYYYVERNTRTRIPETILAQKRYTGISIDEVANLIALKDTKSLNKIAQARRLEGTYIARIAVDTEGVGLSLIISTKNIQATESKPIKQTMGIHWGSETSL